MEVIKALNDSLAYLDAWTKYCISEAVTLQLQRDHEGIETYLDYPIKFLLTRTDSTSVPPINDSILTAKKTDLYKMILERIPSTGSSASSSSNETWQDRMNTDEYNQSLERELRLRQQGYNGAADIERKQRNNWLRGGGYDAYGGGKQVHYKGSKQQQSDLSAIDQYMKEHPDFK